MATLIFDRARHRRAVEKTLQAQPILEQPIELALPRKQLRLEELPFLTQLGQAHNGVLVIVRGFKGYTLKTPVSVQLGKVLALGERGLCEYIFNSLVPTRPALIPWVLENRTAVELASYLLRARSGSKMGLYAYTNTLHMYCSRLNTGPDQLIADAFRRGYTDPERIEKHRGFLQSCLNELQDMGRSPGRMGGYARQIRTFYRCNGVELPKPKYLPSPKVVSRDRSPTQEELQLLIDLADARGKVIISTLALSGVRESTLVALRYSHVKKDLEANIVPVHIKVELDETKGGYCDYPTFLGPECVTYLRAYLNERRQGSLDDGHGQEIPPEEITDDSPFIRDAQSKTIRPIGEKEVYRIVHRLLHKAGLLKRNKNGGYELRVHSIRKFFKTQLQACGVADCYIDFWMGHKTSVYSDMMMKGVEFHRELYSKAQLRIKPEATGSKVDLLKQMVESIGASEDEVREALQSLAKPHRIDATPEQQEDERIQVLTQLFVDKISSRLKSSPHPEQPGDSLG